MIILKGSLIVCFLLTLLLVVYIISYFRLHARYLDLKSDLDRSEENLDRVKAELKTYKSGEGELQEITALYVETTEKLKIAVDQNQKMYDLIELYGDKFRKLNDSIRKDINPFLEEVLQFDLIGYKENEEIRFNPNKVVWIRNKNKKGCNYHLCRTNTTICLCGEIITPDQEEGVAPGTMSFKFCKECQSKAFEEKLTCIHKEELA